MRQLVLVSIVAIVLVTAGSGSSSPRHYPASNGWIVFASDRDINSVAPFRLYRLEPIGGGVAPIGQLRGRQPAWSPDGALIAFVDLSFRLVVARADGTRLRVLTTGRPLAQSPSWSPDGSRIVFQQQGRSSVGDLAVVRADGSALRRITRTDADDRQPDWSPDGSRIAFASNRRNRAGGGDLELWVAHPDGGPAPAADR